MFYGNPLTAIDALRNATIAGDFKAVVELPIKADEHLEITRYKTGAWYVDHFMGGICVQLAQTDDINVVKDLVLDMVS